MRANVLGFDLISLRSKNSWIMSLENQVVCIGTLSNDTIKNWKEVHETVVRAIFLSIRLIVMCTQVSMTCIHGEL